MNNTNYISTSEFVDMNPELDFSLYSEATISGMISRASKNVDNYLQYSLGVEDVVGEKQEASVSNNGNLVVNTRKFPIISVSSVSLKLGTVNLALNLTDGAGNARYDIPSRARSFTYPYQEIAMTGTFSIRNFFQLRGVEIFTVVSYRAGYATIPDDIKDAVSLWAKDIFLRQSNPMGVKSITQGAISITYNDRNADGDSVMVAQAKSILNDYRRII